MGANAKLVCSRENGYKTGTQTYKGRRTMNIMAMVFCTFYDLNKIVRHCDKSGSL